MLEINFDQYCNSIKQFKNIHFHLSTAWIEYHRSQGEKILFFIDNLIQPKIICWALERKNKSIGIFLKVVGLFYSEGLAVNKLLDFLVELKSLNVNGILLNLQTPYSTDFEVAARTALFKKPVGQVSINLTLIVITNEFNPHRNWKRNLKKALSENFKFEIKKEVSQDDCRIIENLSRENSKRRNHPNLFKSSDQIQLFMRASNVFACFLYNDNKPLAVRIISIEQNISYDIFAYNSSESRENGANQYLMEKIFDYLKSKDVQYFDFSGIPVGKKGMHGIYEFKKSSGGMVIPTNGEWCWFKKNWIRHYVYIKNLLIEKLDFY